MSQGFHVDIDTAQRVASSFALQLRELGVPESEFLVCGSVRRQRPTCGDIDVAITAESFTDHVQENLFRSVLQDCFIAKKSQMLKSGMWDGMKIEFYVGPAVGFGAMKLYSTGNPAFNVKCRIEAKKRGWKLSQFGLFDKDSALVCDCTTEGSILQMIGMSEFLNPLSRDVNGWYGH